MRGRFVKTRMPRNPPATANACGRENSCWMNSLGRLDFCVLRVISKPAASEIRKAGTWLTSPSPIVSFVNSAPASAKLMPSFPHANDQSADDVDERDDDARNRVAAHELAGTVHRSVEVGLVRDLVAATLGFLLVDHAGVQIGIDRHLTTRHAVQREACRHFADPRGAFGDHHELNDHDDDEDDQPDDDLVAGHELAEAANHLAGRRQLVRLQPASESDASRPRSTPAGPASWPAATTEKC